MKGIVYYHLGQRHDPVHARHNHMRRTAAGGDAGHLVLVVDLGKAVVAPPSIGTNDGARWDNVPDEPHEALDPPPPAPWPKSC